MEMTIVPKYSFVPSSDKTYRRLYDQKIQNYLQKWGISLQTRNFVFNEPFHHYHKYHLAEAFLNDQMVEKNLEGWINKSSTLMKLLSSQYEIKQIPCSIMSMSFFDKLNDPKNNIVYDSGNFRQRLDVEINEILVADSLRAMILDEECNEYNLYSKTERDEFIFRIFQLVALGGEYCQYEDDLKSYLEVTKALYKDLIRIRKREDNDTFISTIVFEIVAKVDTVPYFLKNQCCKQNVGFLLVDGNKREITAFLHLYSGY